MKRLFLVSLLLISSNLYALDAKECALMEPIDPEFGECLEGEVFDDAIDLLTSNEHISEEVQFRAITSVDEDEEEAPNK